MDGITNAQTTTNNHQQMIKIGSKIPEFELSDQNGTLFRVSSVLGKKNLIIYFYPKDDTPGCTKEACSFQDNLVQFNDINARVIGISGQSVKSHKNFAEKYGLTFTLLSDKGNKVRTLFGVPTNLFGLLPGRVTYVVNKRGMVVSIINSQTDISRHIQEALKTLERIK